MHIQNPQNLEGTDSHNCISLFTMGPHNDSKIFTLFSHSALMHKNTQNFQTRFFPIAHLKLISFALQERVFLCFLCFFIFFYLISSLLKLATGSGNVLWSGVGVVSNDAWQQAVFVWILPSLSPLEPGRLKTQASCRRGALTAPPSDTCEIYITS